MWQRNTKFFISFPFFSCYSFSRELIFVTQTETESWLILNVWAKTLLLHLMTCYSWLPLNYQQIYVWNGADRCWTVCVCAVQWPFISPSMLVGRKKRQAQKPQEYISVNKWLLLCFMWLWEQVYLIDLSIQLDVPVALREEEQRDEEQNSYVFKAARFVLRGERWRLSIPLSEQCRKEKIFQG